MRRRSSKPCQVRRVPRDYCLPAAIYSLGLVANPQLKIHQTSFTVTPAAAYLSLRTTIISHCRRRCLNTAFLRAAVGFNVETVQFKNIRLQVWDLGGQTSIRYAIFVSQLSCAVLI